MTETQLDNHVRTINACNQRGGRMLSLIDLLDSGTVDLPLGAYLAAAMRSGASLLVGARPGGAGKTAVMCALLNFLPDQTTICPTVNPSVLRAARASPDPGRCCYLAHEIGRGNYMAYIWGQDVRDFFALAAQGHTIASNLHADTHQETVEQLCQENGVPLAHLNAVTLQVYLDVERGSGWTLRRQVGRVYECAQGQRRLVWQRTGSARYARRAPSRVVSVEEEQACTHLLAALQHRDIRRIRDVRRALIHPTRDSTIDPG